MPTGYTAKLCEQEQSFSEFALGCARAFGACVMQRDDPSDDLPKSLERDPHHEKSRITAEATLYALMQLSQEEKNALGEKKKKERVESYTAEVAKRQVIHDRLASMIVEVQAWEVPSPEHEGLKKFMLEQLETTIRHDGDTEYYRKCLTEEQAKTPADYFAEEVKSVEWDIEYHTKEDKKSEVRIAEQNKWISELYESIGKHDPAMSYLLLKNK